MDKQSPMYYNLDAIFAGAYDHRPGKRFRYMVNAFQHYNEGDADEYLISNVNKLSSISVMLTELEDMIDNLSRVRIARAIPDAAHNANNNITTFSINGPIVNSPSRDELSCVSEKIVELGTKLYEVDTCAIAEFIRKKAILKGDM